MNFLKFILHVHSYFIGLVKLLFTSWIIFVYKNTFAHDLFYQLEWPVIPLARDRMSSVQQTPGYNGICLWTSINFDVFNIVWNAVQI